MKQNMLVVIFLAGACYAAPKHEDNRQADLDPADWTEFLAENLAKNVHVFVHATVKKFIIVDQEVTWETAKSACESLGGKLAEPKTKKQIKFLGNLFENGKYWIGGRCSGCVSPSDDKWEWASGEHVDIADPIWGIRYGMQSPIDFDYDGDDYQGDHALTMALAKDENSGPIGNDVIVTNFRGYSAYKYICELA